MKIEEGVSDIKGFIRYSMLNILDPIGIKDAPEAADEYDGYVDEICLVLTSMRNRKQLLDYLWSLETENMGLTGDREGVEKFCDLLMEYMKRH